MYALYGFGLAMFTDVDLSDPNALIFAKGLVQSRVDFFSVVLI